jgi:hypothetical protein
MVIFCRYLDTIEVYAPGNPCSGKIKLNPFPQPIAGAFGSFVNGKVNDI